MKTIALSAVLIGFVLVTLGTVQEIFTLTEFVFYASVFIGGGAYIYSAKDI